MKYTMDYYNDVNKETSIILMDTISARSTLTEVEHE